MADPRICMPTARGFTRRAYQVCLYEAQDVLLEMEDVDLICLEAKPGWEFLHGWQKRLLYRDITRKLISFNPRIRKVRLQRDYEVFVAVCQNYADLLYLNAIEGWKDRCKTSVCWLDEVWAANLPSYKYWLHILRRFDHVFVGLSGTVAPLSAILGRPCHYLPGAADAIRFTPQPNPPKRVIDAYSVGRRWEAIHAALLQAAARRELFYLHDTFPSMANLEPTDYRQHRDVYANMAKRSRYFMVSPGKMNDPRETQGQVELGFRYFEGVMAGTIMIGQAPNNQAFPENFPWPDAVIPLNPDGSDVLRILAELNSDPPRVAALSAQNAREALLRHDWSHRWREIYRVAGIAPSPGMLARESRLQKLADSVGDAGGSGF